MVLMSIEAYREMIETSRIDEVKKEYAVDSGLLDAVQSWISGPMQTEIIASYL